MSPTGRAIEHCLSPLIPESQLPFRERGKRERERGALTRGEGCGRGMLEEPRMISRDPRLSSRRRASRVRSLDAVKEGTGGHSCDTRVCLSHRHAWSPI